MGDSDQTSFQRAPIIIAWLEDLEEAFSPSTKPTDFQALQQALTCAPRFIDSAPSMNQVPTPRSPRKANSTPSDSGLADVPEILAAPIRNRYQRSFPDSQLTEATCLNASQPRSKLSRSLSPGRIRILPDLAQAYPPTNHVRINHGKIVDNVLLQEIHDDVEYAMRYRIFPSTMKEALQSHINQWDFQDEKKFYDSDQVEMKPGEYLEEVLNIKEKAEYCEEYKRPEACWGDDVVRPLLVLAHKVAKLGRNARVDNLTTTRVSSLDLMQRSATGNAFPVDTKKVSYGIFLTLPTEITALCRTYLQQYPEMRLNQTNRPEHKVSPLLMSVKINTSTSSDDPLFQLAIWGSAGLQVVCNLCNEDLAPEIIPPTFLMSMKGAECKILYMGLERSKSGLPSRKLYGPVQIGSADSVTGIFTIVNVLKILLQKGKTIQEEFWAAFAGLESKDAH